MRTGENKMHKNIVKELKCVGYDGGNRTHVNVKFIGEDPRDVYTWFTTSDKYMEWQGSGFVNYKFDLVDSFDMYSYELKRDITFHSIKNVSLVK